MNSKFLRAYARKLSKDIGRKVSTTEAEQSAIDTVRKVARNLSSSWTFGYHEKTDIEQQGVMYGLEAIEAGDYDAARPLENFLSIHMRNRLSNFKRDNFTRSEAPCKCCEPFGNPLSPCKKWVDWTARNAAKQNLMRPMDIGNVADEHEPRMKMNGVAIDQSVVNELKALIDAELPVELRRDYLMMLDNKNVSLPRRQAVKTAIISITKGKGYLDAETEAGS